MVSSLILLTLFHAPSFAAECDPNVAGGERVVERINERYDDFFRYHRHLEEREKARDKGRGENKKMLAEHEARMEKARLEYIKNRRPAPDRADLELKAEQERKERNRRLEIARRCYIQQRNQGEALLKRGRMIPGDKEYELEEN